MRIYSFFVACLLLCACSVFAEDAGFTGEFMGVYKPGNSRTMKATAQVIAEGVDKYRIVLKAEPSQPGEDWVFVEIYGTKQGQNLDMAGRSGGRDWTGSIKGNKMTVQGNYYDMAFELDRITRMSPTLGLKPPKNAVVLLPYELGKAPDLSQWTNANWKPLPDGSMIHGGGNNPTKRSFGSIKLHLEFKIPFQPDKFNQARGNSGVFFNGVYETQVLDSFGVIPALGDCGAIYGVSTPHINASLPPLEWQTYDVTFIAPRIDEKGKVLSAPRITVVQNGITIQKDVEIPTQTRFPLENLPHVQRAPLMLQDHGNDVCYRNIWVVELKQ